MFFNLLYVFNEAQRKIQQYNNAEVQDYKISKFQYYKITKLQNYNKLFQQKK